MTLHRLTLGIAGCIVGLGLLHAAGAADTAVTAAGITLKSVSVTFPSSDVELPGGNGADVIAQNCTACHSAGMILTQPALNEATWREEVNKMRTVYKAPVPAEDVPAIVAYLVEHKGTK